MPASTPFTTTLPRSSAPILIPCPMASNGLAIADPFRARRAVRLCRVKLYRIVGGHCYLFVGCGSPVADFARWGSVVVKLPFRARQRASEGRHRTQLAKFRRLACP